jgi:UDP-N-acetylmuramoyl-L-alanyl-D-glutamate--2,6-diaminopimelate ligase
MGTDSIRPERVAPTSVAELALMIGADGRGSETGTVVTGVTLRAQSVRTGDLFAALPGARVHGASYAADALRGGATAILTDPDGAVIVDAECNAPDGVAVLVHPDPRAVLGAVAAAVYRDPSSSLTVIGITGTSGKTTTAYMVESAMMSAGHSVGVIGTVGTRINGAAVPSSLTTPEAPDLQALLATMLERGVDTVVMEVSSHALRLGRVAGVLFAVGGFTNLSQDHLDFHPTMEDYFLAKSALLDPASPMAAATAVICVDDEWGAKMAAIAADPTTVATVDQADRVDSAARRWTAVVATDGPSTLLDPDGGVHRLPVPLPGRFNVTNAALAVALCAAAGADVDRACAGIADVAVPGRLEPVRVGQDFLAVVDYAHKPAAVEAVLGTLAADCPGRIAVVLGAGGDRDRGKRPQMGAAAARGADLVIITDDNPRTEEPAAIRAAVLAGALAVEAEQRRATDIREVGDRAAAIADAVAWAQSGDVVLIAGKGHETGQEINGVKHDFDDRVVLRRALTASSPGRRQITVIDDGASSSIADGKSLLRRLVEVAADSGAGSAHRGAPGEPGAPRTWLVLGELADDGDMTRSVVDHDLLGRSAVRLAVDKVVCVGDSRAVRAAHQGAVMEGSWGDEATLLATAEELAHTWAAPGAGAPAAGDVIAMVGDWDRGPVLAALAQRDLVVEWI